MNGSGPSWAAAAATGTGIIICGLLFVLSLSGCASYSYSFNAVEHAIVEQKPDQALAVLEKLHKQGSFFKKADVLYLLNKAMVLRMQQQYEASNQAFEQAKLLIEQYDAFSLTEQAGSFMFNDATRAYMGEPFEQVLLHLYAALNYLELGKPDDARVEALQVDQRLQRLNSKIKNPVYTEDAFVRYLTGIIYEQLGEYSNAMIACRKAYEAYQKYQTHFGVHAPESLQQALLRLSKQQGLDDEYRRYQQAFNEQEKVSVYQRRDFGELVLVVNSGLAPVKREEGVTTIVPTSGQLVRVAVPKYMARADNLRGINVRAINRDSNSEVQSKGELVQDIDNIAFKTLEAEMPTILARSAARVVTKYQVTRELSRQDNALGILSNVFNILTERADTRSWLTLPKTIHLVRIALEPGTYDINLEFLSSYGAALENKQMPGITINPGQTHYITHHRVPAVALSESLGRY
ncbi:COG3014 family protein [Kaarinaea lacus]